MRLIAWKTWDCDAERKNTHCIDSRSSNEDNRRKRSLVFAQASRLQARKPRRNDFRRWTRAPRLYRSAAVSFFTAASSQKDSHRSTASVPVAERGAGDSAPSPAARRSADLRHRRYTSRYCIDDAAGRRIFFFFDGTPLRSRNLVFRVAFVSRRSRRLEKDR